MESTRTFPWHRDHNRGQAVDALVHTQQRFCLHGHLDRRRTSRAVHPWTSGWGPLACPPPWCPPPGGLHGWGSRWPHVRQRRRRCWRPCAMSSIASPSQPASLVTSCVKSSRPGARAGRQCSSPPPTCCRPSLLSWRWYTFSSIEPAWGAPQGRASRPGFFKARLHRAAGGHQASVSGPGAVNPEQAISSSSNQHQSSRLC